jgi:4-methoxybenzoate monooxygenase (O-demethylating)
VDRYDSCGMSATLTTSDYDPFTPEAILDAHTHDGALRDIAPAVYLERYDVWAVARFADVQAMLKDWETFTSTNRPFFDPNAIRPNILLTEDPPDHNRTRAVIMRSLSAPALRRMKDEFDRAAVELVDRLLESAPTHPVLDGHLDIASAYVLQVFPDILGLSREGRHHLLRFGDAAFNAFGPANEIQRRGMERAADAIAWVDRSVKRDAVDPDGLGGEMFKAADSGEITEGEAELLVRTLFAAGSDTTIYGIGNMIRAFAENPDQWRILREDRSLVRNAFEEVLRFESPSRFGGRATKGEAEVDGVRLPAGARIMVMFLTAGRDPRRWENPDTFDIRRKVTGHINLGYGIHACAGQALARIEGQAILQALVDRVAAIEPAGEPERAINFQAHGHEHIPVRLVPA